jgi:nucleoside-diphosphate-sugar epimerase
MTAIISGSTGFVGENLIKYFERLGINFLPLSREDLYKSNAIQFGKGDTVIHLAGKAHDLKKVSASEEYYQVNFELTKKLYDAFLNSEASKFIFISSVKASADQVEDVLKESDVPDPKTHYGKSKLMAEEYIQSQPLPDSKSYYILRPCMIHGPGNKGNLNLLYKLISKGIPYPLAAFENKRSFLSIDNLCFVIREIVERNDIPSGIYQVADDETLSTNELVKLIAQALGHKARLWNISPGLIRSIAKLGDVLHLPLTNERLNKLTENYIVDTTKIKQALGKELPVGARDGILKTIRSFR